MLRCTFNVLAIVKQNKTKFVTHGCQDIAALETSLKMSITTMTRPIKFSNTNEILYIALVQLFLVRYDWLSPSTH